MRSLITAAALALLPATAFASDPPAAPAAAPPTLPAAFEDPDDVPMPDPALGHRIRVGLLPQAPNGVGAHLAGAVPQGSGLDAAAMIANPRRGYLLVGIEAELDLGPAALAAPESAQQVGGRVALEEQLLRVGCQHDGEVEGGIELGPQAFLHDQCLQQQGQLGRELQPVGADDRQGLLQQRPERDRRLHRRARVGQVQGDPAGRQQLRRRMPCAVRAD